jgi:hypothetical protein
MDTGKVNTGKTMKRKVKRLEEEEKPGFLVMVGHGTGARVRCFNCCCI